MNGVDPKCDANDVEKDDNFCYKCGSFTAKGYAYLQDERNVNKIARRKNSMTIKVEAETKSSPKSK